MDGGSCGTTHGVAWSRELRSLPYGTHVLASDACPQEVTCICPRKGWAAGMLAHHRFRETS